MVLFVIVNTKCYMIEKKCISFFHKINGCIEDYDGITYLTLIPYDEKYEKNIWQN